MEIIYTLVYHPKVISDDIPQLNGSWKKKIKSSVEGKLLTEPLLYGKPIRRDLYGCYKLRVGEYRVIYDLDEIMVNVYIMGTPNDDDV